MLKIESQATPYTITLEVNTKELNELFDNHWDIIKNDIEIEGFRKGNIPKEVAEKKIGYDNLYSKLIPELYMQELQKSKIDIVYSSEPKIFGHFNREGFLRLVADCYLTPEVKLGSFSKIHVEKTSIYILDTDVEKELDKLKQKYATSSETSDPIKYGDTILLDFIGFVDGIEIQGSKGINYKLIVGSNNFIEGFEDQLIGLKQFDQRDITVKFPDKYHKETLAGKSATFNVKVRGVYKNSTISDEDLTQYEKRSLDEIKNQIKNDLLIEKETLTNKELSADILKQLVKISEIGPIPQPCLYQEMDQKLEQFVNDTGKTLEELKVQFPNFEAIFENNHKNNVIEGIHATLVLQKLQKIFHPTVTDEEINQFCMTKYNEIPDRDTTRWIVAESQIKIKKTLQLLVEKITT
jgi:trigger factor